VNSDSTTHAVEFDTAARAARSAGAAAMLHYGRARAELTAGDSPVTAADYASNRVILQMLAQHFPGDAVLSEESRDSEARLASDRVWIVDPLDGTKEFLAQNGEFSVMIALAVRGEPVVGVVYRPDGDTLFGAVRGGGAWVERGGVRLPLRCPSGRAERLRMVGSRSHAEPLLERMQQALGVSEIRPSGSVGIKCALIGEGECDVYIHPVPYLKEWDTCAPEIILREAGGEVTDCTGAPLRYNKPDPVQPHGIVACAPGLSRRVLSCIAPLYGERAA
jgi:3'(2'), 5'-bisphosphate nucleotidase